MRIELEEKDLQRIANMVVEKLRPILVSVPSHGTSDTTTQENDKCNLSEKDGFMDMKKLCEYLGTSQRWVRTRMSNRELPHHKIGNLVRFKKKDIDTFMRTIRAC